MLANDLRPKTLDEVRGNQATVESMRTLFEGGVENFPSALLFHGASGTGKTTLARIVVSEVGCVASQFHEINAADTRGIDTIRELIETAMFAPLVGATRVILFDEAHQLTTPAQQALLKAVEDTSAHTFWIFCTTHVQGIIPTIKNRCAAFATNPLRPAEMRKLLVASASEIVEQALETELIEEIVAAADGSARMGLTILEKVAFMGDLDAAIDVVQAERSDGVEPEVIELCRLLVSKGGGRWKTAQAFLLDIKVEPERVRCALAGYFRSCLLKEKNAEDAARFANLIEFVETALYSGSANAQLAKMVYDCAHV